MDLGTIFQPLKGIMLLLGFIYSATHAYAQREFEHYGHGARATGMAHAFNAVADDATAMSWNPAGMVQVKKPECAFVNHLTATDYSNEYWDMYGFSYQPIYNFDYLGLVYPLKIKNKDLVFGISFQNKINFKSRAIAESTNRNIHSKNSLTVNSVSLSGAFSVTRFLGIGISFNEWFSLGNTYNWYSEFAYTGSYLDTAIYERDRHNNYTGYNFSAGVLLDFSSIRLPLRFTAKYENSVALEGDYDCTIKRDSIFENNTSVTWFDLHKGAQKKYIPGVIALGLSYRIGDYFTIAADYDIKLFGDSLYTITEYNRSLYYYRNEMKTQVLEEAPVDSSWLDKTHRNVNQFRIGVEYILHPRFALIPVRAGWKYNPASMSSYKKKTINGREVFVADKQIIANSINVGTGYLAKRFSIDVAYEWYQYERIDSDGDFEKKALHMVVLSAFFYIR
ncbi:MAG: outer membrane protein transport protein [Bacteroidales bacterium]|nr:outer membrane protein transport protein [Bacteroidales bacterium]